MVPRVFASQWWGVPVVGPNAEICYHSQSSRFGGQDEATPWLLVGGQQGSGSAYLREGRAHRRSASMVASHEHRQIRDSEVAFRILGKTWFVLPAYIFLGVVMTWPVAAQLGTSVPGGTSDLWVHQWVFWWVKKSLMSGHGPFYTDLLFYPQGVSLAYQNIAWLNIAAWLPLQAILGSLTAYSLTYMAVFPFNAFAMYVFAREVLDSTPAAFVGGIVFGFWPYTLSQYGHPNMMVIFGVPLALYFLKRTMEKHCLRDALLAGLFLGLTGIARWQLLVMASGIVVLHVLWIWAADPASRTRRSLGMLVVSGLTAVALMAPLAVPVLSAYFSNAHPEDMLVGDAATGQTDLLAYVLPTRYHPLWIDAAAKVYENFIHNKVYVPFLGYSVIALAVLGVVKCWRQAAVWLLAALVYVLLALGPVLRVNGQLYPGVPMLYRLFDDLVLVRALRNPDRFNALLGLPVAMLGATGLRALVGRIADHRFRALIVLLGCGLILLEYNLLPYHTEQPLIPEWYREIADQSERFAVLDLPMEPQVYDKHYMYYQTMHGKPLVEGHVSRPPDDAFAFIEEVPLLRGLRRTNAMDPGLVDVSHQLEPLAEADIRYIILHKDFASGGQLAAWKDWLTFDPLHEDGDLVVYATDPQLGRDFVLHDKLTDDVGLLNARLVTTQTLQGAVLKIDVRWGSAAAPPADYDACLALSGFGGDVAERRCMPLSSSWPTSRWGTEEVVRSSYRLKVPSDLATGEYEVTMALSESETGVPVGRPTGLGVVRVDTLEPAHPFSARMGDVLALRGYDLKRLKQSLELTLYWQAQRAMDASYKVFVHLVHVPSGEIRVQDDAVPRRWTYPTTEWQRGEIVDDTILLSTRDLAPGEYILRVGCYDQTTGGRLPAYDGDGKRYADDAVTISQLHWAGD